jgi:hypothetical protein
LLAYRQACSGNLNAATTSIETVLKAERAVLSASMDLENDIIEGSDGRG